FATEQWRLDGPARTVVSQIVRSVRGEHSAHPADAIRVGALGEASRRWRHPSRRGADADNQDLSWKRARTVAEALRSGLPPEIAVAASAVGSAIARSDGMDPNDNSQRYREVLVTGLAQEPGTPPIIVPGRPGTPGDPGTPDQPGTPDRPGTPDQPGRTTPGT